jgi:hypothetical protein
MASDDAAFTEPGEIRRVGVQRDVRHPPDRRARRGLADRVAVPPSCARVIELEVALERGDDLVVRHGVSSARGPGGIKIAVRLTASVMLSGT